MLDLVVHLVTSTLAGSRCRWMKFKLWWRRGTRGRTPEIPPSELEVGFQPKPARGGGRREEAGREDEEVNVPRVLAR